MHATLFLEMEDQLVKLITSFDRVGSSSNLAKECLEFLENHRGRERQAHPRLCCAMLSQAEGGNLDMRDVLHFVGAAEVFSVVYDNMTRTKLSTAKWLAGELSKLIQSGGFTAILTTQAKCVTAMSPSSRMLLSSWQQLVSIVCRLPDVLANRLGRQLKESLLPLPYFRLLGESFRDSLVTLHKDAQGDESKYSLAFHAALLGQAATLRYHRAVLEALLPFLERQAMADISWSKLSQSLISQIPSPSLEPILEAIISHTSPSLLPSSPLAALIGRDILANHRARLILTHKLILVRVPSSPRALPNVLGYLAASETGRDLLRKSLLSALEVWSDPTALRHMDGRQHLWVSRVLVLGVNLLQGHKNWEVMSADFLKLLLSGVQIHIQSALTEVRHIGMAVGQTLMNMMHPMKDDTAKLNFDYEPSPDTEAIEKLARPVQEQEEDLRELRGERGGVSCSGNAITASTKPKDEEVCSSRSSSSSLSCQFGEGYVHAVECSDDDSDDDLVPYAMDDDPDASRPSPPRYLRTLMQDLVSSKEPQKVEVGLRAAEDIIRSRPSDLSEVCVELAKILLHLSDNYSLDDFCKRRHSALVALTTLSPDLVTPYLTQEFYAPNYSLRHRMDILEVISSAALELSQPPPSSTTTLSSSSRSHVSWSARKPWEDIINQRLKSKTKFISKGPRQPAARPVPNRFTSVAPLFFFPLMNRVDQSINTLDLLGEDSLVLGNLLYTLGTVMYAASNLPAVVAMALAFLDFLWALRYHQDIYVRQGVLYGLGMMMCATPRHVLLGELSLGMVEAVSWMREVAKEDPDQKARTLAAHALSVFSANIKEHE